MHPQEAYKQKTGTGRLASLSLENSEIIIDSSFDENLRVQELLSDPFYYPMVLYPGKEAHDAETFRFSETVKKRVLLIFLIDATWILARKMMYRSPSLQILPKLSFSREYRSHFHIKKQPQDFCLSTIESTYYLIKELQQAGICDKQLQIEGLLNIFNRMVQFQENCKDKRLSHSKISLSK
jgi:DTW domain-containing protein YfiP